MVCPFGVGILQIGDTFENWFSLLSSDRYSCGRIVLMLMFNFSICCLNCCIVSFCSNIEISKYVVDLDTKKLSRLRFGQLKTLFVLLGILYIEDL